MLYMLYNNFIMCIKFYLEIIFNYILVKNDNILLFLYNDWLFVLEFFLGNGMVNG